MRKLLITAFAIIASLTATAQITTKIGVHGGLNLTKMKISSDVLNADNDEGFYIGPTIKFGLPFGFDIDVAALYDQRSFKAEIDENVVEGDIEKTSMKKKSIDLQANLRKGFGLGDKASIFVFAGPQFAFNIGNKDALKLDTYREIKWKDNDVSINLGIGVMLLNNLEIKTNYNIACGKAGEVKMSEIGNSTLPDALKDAWNGNLKSNAWQIGATLYF